MEQSPSMACPPASAGALRIMTWNVNGLRPMLNRRICSISKVLQDLQADIICIQETKLSKSDMESLRTIGISEGWQVNLQDTGIQASMLCTSSPRCEQVLSQPTTSILLQELVLLLLHIPLRLCWSSNILQERHSNAAWGGRWPLWDRCNTEHEDEGVSCGRGAFQCH